MVERYARIAPEGLQKKSASRLDNVLGYAGTAEG
jgi:hypothetical protein